MPVSMPEEVRSRSTRLARLRRQTLSVASSVALMLGLTAVTPWLGEAHSLAGLEDHLSSAVIDPAGEFAYFGTDTDPGHVVKVDLATFAQVDAITLEAGEGPLHSAVIDPGGAFAYFGTGTVPGRVVKVDLDPLARVSALALATNESYLNAAAIDPAGGSAYFGTTPGDGAGRAVKVDLATFTRASFIAYKPLPSGEAIFDSAVIDPAGDFAYFGTTSGPDGHVFKVPVADSGPADAITLAGGEYNLFSAVIDPAGAFAYFGASPTAGPGRVVKVDLATFTRVGAISVDAGLRAAVMDPAGAFAYFGTLGGKVVKVDLATFTRVGAISLEGGLRSAVIDPAGAFAYFGTRGGKVVKVDLATFTRVGAITLEEPPPTPANGKIAFAGEGHIEVINADGTGRATLDAASPASSVREPAWNETGLKLVFRDSGSSFSTMDADGSNVKPLVGMSSFAGNPTWSANGSVIAFDGYIGGINQENRIYTVPATGGTATQLVALDAKDPTYSPDGTKIAFEYDEGIHAIGVMNADGSGAVNITPGGSGNAGDYDPSWSPDGTKIVFTRARQIWTMNANGSGAIQLTTGTDDSYPTWSPDGTKIAFERAGDIWVMDTDGSDAANITNTPDVDEREPDWGLFAEPEASITTLTVDKTSRKLQARGAVSPPHGGLTVSVTLFKKKGGSFVNIGTKKPVLTSESKYSASFGRPSSGTCKMKARFPGDSHHLSSAVSKIFKC